MAKIAVLFLLFALVAFCSADEVKKEEGQPDQLDIGLKQAFANTKEFLEKNFTPEKISNMAKSIQDNAKQFFEKAQEEYKKIGASATDNKA